MAIALLKQIEQAEEQAEQLRAQALREARDMVKSVEEAQAAQARQSLRDIHEGAQRLVEEARIGTRDEIKALEVRRSAEREAMKGLAEKRVRAASERIFERIVKDGAC